MPSAGKCRRSFPGPPQNTKGLIYDNADQSPAKPLQGNNIPVADGGAVGCFLRSYWMELDAREGRIRPFGRMVRSEEHTSELQSLMRISYAVFCLKKKKIKKYVINYYFSIILIYLTIR